MKMKLSKQSWHYKLYMFAYGRYAKQHNNLCPYFWKVLVAIILIVPFCIIFGLLWVLPDFKEFVYEDGCISPQVIASGAIGWIAAFFIFLMTGGMFMKMFFVGGCFLWLLCITIGGIILINYVWRGRRERASKEKRPNILVEFIKAKYNNYCPKIDWEQNN